MNLDSGTPIIQYQPVDGGRVEISIDNQATWTDLDALFTQNGYDDFILNDSSLPAFGGMSNTSYIETIADLSSFSGEYIFIRFTMFLVGFPDGIGWNIDDITISNIEKTVNNIGYFTATPGIDQSITLFPPTDVIPGTCTDGILNGTETSIDMGGNCTPPSTCDFDLTLTGDPAAGGTF